MNPHRLPIITQADLDAIDFPHARFFDVEQPESHRPTLVDLAAVLIGVGFGLLFVFLKLNGVF